ncbi:major facilitator superfamily domain-containing protein [Aspergillus pseudoustus]|uniref:Major facilitator superfamily domain-containing protein n=1 Tax=Aspergillus pseudoustus TaxID=1810923 RepID=A0ABR4KQH1_9EURO
MSTAPSSPDEEKRSLNHPEPGQTETNVAPDGGLRAWLVAAGAAAIFFSTLGLANSFGAFESYYIRHQLSSESESTISWIGSLQSFLQFFSGLLGGPLFDRYGSMLTWRIPQVIYPSAIAYVFAIMMLSLCTNYWQTMLVQGVLMGLVMGFLQIPAFAAVSQYFDKRRAAALGIAVSGSSIGGIIMPIILSKMLNASTIGFAWTVRIIGFVILPFMLFACIAIKPRLPPRKTRLFLWAPYKQPRFLLLVAALFFMFIGMFTPFFYLTSYAMSRGMGAALAGYLLALVNATSTLGRIVPGILADRYGRLNIFATGGISTGVVIFCMTAATSNAGLIVYALFFGFASGTIVSGASAAFASCPKDARDIGTYMGMGMAVAGVGGLIGPPINGAILDAYGEYLRVCVFSGVMAVVGGVIAFVAKMGTDEGVWGRS